MNNLDNKIIQKNIIQFFSDTQLLKLKVVSKKFNKLINCHNQYLKCAICKNNRFRVCSNKSNCYVKNCISNSIFHPYIQYFNNQNEPICSFGCLIGNKN